MVSSRSNTTTFLGKDEVDEDEVDVKDNDEVDEDVFDKDKDNPSSSFVAIDGDARFRQYNCGKYLSINVRLRRNL